MATRDIRTFHETIACDLCGRTLLRGERVETWLAGGSRREVCELCSERALHEGWIREGTHLDVDARSPSGERRRSLLSRLRERGRAAAAQPREEPLDVPAAEAPAPRMAPPPPPPPPPVEPVLPREPRSVHAVPTDPGHRMVAALERFNASEHPRTVAGVARSLGGPEVAVRPLPGTSRVSVVVAWELSWYRYEVELADEVGGVTQVAQGYELAELDEVDRVPNAAADEYGRLQLLAG